MNAALDTTISATLTEVVTLAVTARQQFESGDTAVGHRTVTDAWQLSLTLTTDTERDIANAALTAAHEARQS